MNNLVDLNFGIDKQAMSILHLLNREPDFADSEGGYYYYFYSQTRPWYNGRECGVVISVYNRKRSKVLHIAFYEHRNSDSIHALKWETKHMYWNHPLENPDIFEIAYKNKGKYDTDYSVSYGEIGKMADWIWNEIKNFYEKVSQ